MFGIVPQILVDFVMKNAILHGEIYSGRVDPSTRYARVSLHKVWFQDESEETKFYATLRQCLVQTFWFREMALNIKHVLGIKFQSAELKALAFFWCEMSDDFAAVLGLTIELTNRRGQGLENIGITGCRISGDGLEHLFSAFVSPGNAINVVQLQDIPLSRSLLKSLVNSGQYHNLRNLQLENTGLDDIMFAELCRLLVSSYNHHSLVRLNVRRNAIVNFSPLLGLVGVSPLADLAIGGNPLSRFSVETVCRAIIRSSSLSEISLRDTAGLSDDSVMPLMRVPLWNRALMGVYMSSTGVSEKLADRLAKLLCSRRQSIISRRLAFLLIAYQGPGRRGLPKDIAKMICDWVFVK